MKDGIHVMTKSLQFLWLAGVLCSMLSSFYKQLARNLGFHMSSFNRVLLFMKKGQKFAAIFDFIYFEKLTRKRRNNFSKIWDFLQNYHPIE